MRRLLLIVLALAAIVYLSLPPVASPLPPPPALPPSVHGAFHVHTRRSDGGGSVEQVAKAAARAGLQFVILTDHGNATRFEAPAYHDGVLVIDAVEISSDGGHVVALGLPRAPYPLGGETRDVLEDVARMGGFSIAAHPSAPNGESAWADWSAVPGGLEFLNADNEWRDEHPLQLARVLLAYPARPADALALLFDRDEPVLRRWDALTRRSPTVAVAAADAHAHIRPPSDARPYTGRLALPLPTYESVFRAVSIAVPGLELRKQADVDASAVIEAIRAGGVYSSIDALGARPRFSFSASSGSGHARAGSALPLAGPVRIDVQVQAPADAQIGLVRDGVQLLETRGTSLRYEAERKPAVFRVEVKLPAAPGAPPVPWIVSNPIYVGRAASPAPPPREPARARLPIYTDGPANGWNVEHDAASQAALDVVKGVSGTHILFRYALSGAAASRPFAALTVPAAANLAAHAGLGFTGRADRPMRLAVQLRAPGGGEGERWQRSVYLDSTPRQVFVRFDDMRPRGPAGMPRPRLEAVRSLLFTVDTINTATGTAGRVAIDDVRYER